MLLARALHERRVAFRELPVAIGSRDLIEVGRYCFAPKNIPLVNEDSTTMKIQKNDLIYRLEKPTFREILPVLGVSEDSHAVNC